MESSRNQEMQRAERGGPPSWPASSHLFAVVGSRPAVLQASIQLADCRCSSVTSVAPARGQRKGGGGGVIDCEERKRERGGRAEGEQMESSRNQKMQGAERGGPPRWHGKRTVPASNIACRRSAFSCRQHTSLSVII